MGWSDELLGLCSLRYSMLEGMKHSSERGVVAGAIE